MNLGHGLTTAQGRISWNMLTNIMWFHFLQQPATSVQSKARLVQLLRQRLQLSAEEASQWYVSLGSRPGIDPRLAGCCQKGLLRNAGGLQAEYVCFLAICCNTVEQIGSARSLPLFLCRMCVLWGLASLLNRWLYCARWCLRRATRFDVTINMICSSALFCLHWHPDRGWDDSCQPCPQQMVG